MDHLGLERMHMKRQSKSRDVTNSQLGKNVNWYGVRLDSDTYKYTPQRTC